MIRWVKIFSGIEEAQRRITPNKPQLLIVDGVRICLVLYAEAFYAVQDACTHNRESLSKGRVNHLGEIICPWHEYCFNLNTGRELSLRSNDLKTYSIKIDETGFYLGV